FDTFSTEILLRHFTVLHELLENLAVRHGDLSTFLDATRPIAEENVFGPRGTAMVEESPHTLPATHRGLIGALLGDRHPLTAIVLSGDKFVDHAHGRAARSDNDRCADTERVDW